MTDPIAYVEGQLQAMLPCPFCGNTEPQIRSNGIGDFYVICETEWEGEKSCGARSSDVRCETESGAVSRWNRRAPDASQSITRLKKEWNTLRAALLDLEFIFEGLEDIVDGPEGQQLPNDAMKAMTIIRAALY